MNSLQISRQLKFLLDARNWEGSSASGAEVVFATGSVLIAEGLQTEAGAWQRFPAAIIEPAETVSDPEEPTLIVGTFDVTLLVVVPGDAQVENAMIGANRSATTSFGQLSSRGRGLLEVETELKAVLAQVNEIFGIQVIAFSTGETGSEEITDLGFVTFRTYSFSAQFHDELFYHPTLDFAAVDAVAAGDADLTWTLAPTRFDTRRVRIRRAAGAVPPATIADGVEIVLPTDLPTSFTDSPGAGAFSYSSFMAYDETNSPASEDQRFSGPDSDSVTVT